jgi:hypothetical protein
MLIIAESGNIFDSHGMRACYTHIDKEMVYLYIGYPSSDKGNYLWKIKTSPTK